MATKRVRPQDIGIRKGNVKLATKKLKEVRCQLYTDQCELMDDWTRDHSTTVTNVMRKLFNYFLHLPEAKRKYILREY